MMNYFHRFIPKSQRLRDLRRSRKVALCGKNQGQAMVEYMLMLIVVVILIVGLTLAVFKPLSDFLGKLNNIYISCLLETGELPKVEADGAASCDDKIPKFQVGNLDGSPVNPNNPGSSQNNENKKGESSSADGSSGDEASGAGSGAGAGGNNPAGGGRKSSMIRNGMRIRGNARGESGGDKVTNLPIDNFDAGDGFMQTNGAGRYGTKGRQKSKRIDLSGLTEYERKKIEREQQKSRTVAVDSESFTQKKNKKLIVKPPEEKKSEDDMKVETDFSYYFKIFFFIVIILFIIILMGSQAMQMTNSSE